VKSKGLLDVATYPTISFTSVEVRDQGGNWVVSGVVTAHGTTAPVEVIIDGIDSDDDGLVIRGRVEHIDRLILGVTGSRGMVGRYLNLEVDAVAVPA
jgi:polyisoprenoid-binding protein YceI